MAGMARQRSRRSGRRQQSVPRQQPGIDDTRCSGWREPIAATACPASLRRAPAVGDVLAFPCAGHADGYPGGWCHRCPATGGSGLSRAAGVPALPAARRRRHPPGRPTRTAARCDAARHGARPTTAPAADDEHISEDKDDFRNSRPDPPVLPLHRRADLARYRKYKATVQKPDGIVHRADSS